MSDLENTVEIINGIGELLIDTISNTEQIEQIVDIGSDILNVSLPGFKLALNITNKIKVQKFKLFLIGIHKSCTNQKVNGRTFKDKLLQLSSKSIYRDFLTSAYESAINAKSLKNTAMLGFFLAKTTLNKIDLNLESFIICNALKELSDLEVEIFQKIYEHKIVEKEGDYIDINKVKIDELDIETLELVIEIFKTVRIVSRGIGSFEFSEQARLCRFNKISESFYLLTKNF